MIYIYVEKGRKGAAHIGVLVGKRRKIAGKEIFFGKKTFSTLSVEEEIGKIFGGRLEGKYRERD